jgi:hypothetical protein
VESYIWVLVVYIVFVESIEFTNRHYRHVGEYLNIAHEHDAQYNMQ